MRLKSCLRGVMPLLLGLSACTHDARPGDPLSADLSSVPAQLTTLADWDKIDAQTRHDLVEGDYTRVKGLTMTKRQLLGDVTNLQAKQLAQAMAAFMHKNADMQVEDDSHARVGPQTVWVQFLTLGSGTIAAGCIDFEQVGCDLPDNQAAHTFPTAAEAQAAKCKMLPGGGGWSAYGSFNHDVGPFEYSDFMTWNGPSEPRF